MSSPRSLALVFAFAFSVAACSSSSDDTTPPAPPPDRVSVARNYAAIVEANYTETESRAVDLARAIDAFVAAPSESKLEAAKAAWIASRIPYAQSEAYRFYGGPIDAEETGPEGRLNAWPLDESYIDYVEGAPEAGVVNRPDRFPTIDEALLVSLNEKDGETNIASGYHAIEFLLWGQDLRDDGPGNRPYTDYVVGTGKNAERRGAYLRAAAALLVRDVRAVKEAWASSSSYRVAFEANPDAALQKMLVGIGSLSGGELGGERTRVAYTNKDQEDEHDCFSDTTLSDLRGNALGIQNVYLGHYGAVAGPSLSDLVRAVDPALDATMRTRIQGAIDAIAAIPPPFDRAILGADDAPGRVKVKAAIDAIASATLGLADVASRLGVRIDIEK
jgi:putative iron-regulated protein